MGVICQVALALTGWIAVDVFARLATETLTAMGNSGDAEVQRLGEELAWATGIMKRTALALAAPALGMLAWLVFLRPSGEAATHFATDVPADSAPMPDARVAHAPSSATPHTWMPAAPLAAPPAVARHDASNPRPRPGIVSQAARVGLVVLGALMLLFGAADGLRARASYVDSQPAAGVTLASSPRAVRVTLAARLGPGSSLSIIRLAGKPGEFPRDVKIASRLAPDDPDQRTIEGLPTRLCPRACIAWPGGRGPLAGVAPNKARSPSASPCLCPVTRRTTSIP